MQEAIRKAVKEWVDEANKNNVARMLQENKELNDTPVNSEIRSEEVARQSPTEDETWQVLADCQITLPLVGLLKLVGSIYEKK
mgnify:CR=1 FL=1